MPTVITSLTAEKSARLFSVSFTDDAGASVIPNANTITWKLTDRRGNIVNSRTAVAVASAATITIVLSGSDLANSSSYVDRWRCLTVNAEYNSGTGGNNLPLKQDVWFVLDNMVGVT